MDAIKKEDSGDGGWDIDILLTIDDKIEREAADLWHLENPTQSVFDCDAETTESYRRRVRRLYLDRLAKALGVDVLTRRCVDCGKIVNSRCAVCERDWAS